MDELAEKVFEISPLQENTLERLKSEGYYFHSFSENAERTEKGFDIINKFYSVDYSELDDVLLELDNFMLKVIRKLVRNVITEIEKDKKFLNNSITFMNYNFLNEEDYNERINNFKKDLTNKLFYYSLIFKEKTELDIVYSEELSLYKECSKLIKKFNVLGVEKKGGSSEIETLKREILYQDLTIKSLEEISIRFNYIKRCCVFKFFL